MSSRQDPFALFKKSAGDPEIEAEDAADEEPYVLPPLRPETYTAMRLGKRRERLFVYRAAQPMRFPAYHELKDINFDPSHQIGFNLFFHAATFEVMGRNLWPVVHAIASNRCAAIFEYSSALYPSLPGKNEPLIESIKLMPPRLLVDG